MTRAGFVRPGSSRVLWRPTLSVAPASPVRPESNAFVGSRGSFRRSTPSTPLSRSRAPSTDESPVRAHPLARMGRSESRHRCLGFAASARLPTRIRAVGTALDLSPSLSGRRLPRGKASSPPCGLEREGRVPLVDFCSCHGSTSTAASSPDPVFLVASHLWTGDDARERRQLGPVGSGVCRPPERSRNAPPLHPHAEVD